MQQPPDNPAENASDAAALLQRLQETQERLRQSESRYAAMLATAIDCIIVIDHRGIITEWNPAAEKTFGFSRDEVLGKAMADLIIPPAMRAMHHQGLARFLTTGEGPILGKRIEITALRKNGTEFSVELSIRAVGAGPAPIFIGQLRDITARKEADEALAAAKGIAERANSAKDQFIAVLSHELRTPLTPVVTMLQMMENDESLTAEQRKSIQLILRNVNLETRLIDDLLDITKISRGKLALNYEAVDLHSVLRHVVGNSDSDLRAKQLSVSVELHAAHHHVRGDATRLHQVFWNLIKNAVKFTPTGGAITVRTDQPTADRVTISVQDTGVGIDSATLPQIFNAFVQGPHVAARHFGGLGLGLAISKELVELHGGSLTAASEGPNQGSTFSVELRPSLIAEGLPALQSKPRSITAPTPRPGRLLLVEDHPDTGRIIGRLLRSFGYNVRVADSVASAFAAAAAERFDILVCDIGLPDGSGLDVVRHLSAKHPIKAIAISGYGMEEDIRKSKEAGFLAHLTKPVDINTLAQLLEDISRK